MTDLSYSGVLAAVNSKQIHLLYQDNAHEFEKTGWSCGFQIEAQFGRPGSVFGSKQTVEFAF